MKTVERKTKRTLRNSGKCNGNAGHAVQTKKPLVLLAPLLAALAVVLGFLFGRTDARTGSNGSECSSSELNQGLMIYAIDVGQGDCFLLISPNGRTMLIDSGEKSEVGTVLDFLDLHGVSRIDIVVATHPHTDHIGGLSRIISEVDTDTILMPQVEYDTATYNDLLDTIKDENVDLVYAWSGCEVEWDESCDIDVLAPIRGAEYSDSDVNEWSIIMRVGYEDASMLFTGDAETHAEQLSMFYNERELFKADVLKVAHHGSAYSSSVGFLETVDPDVAVISVGRGNSYGHPDFDTLNKLKLMGTDVYRTDELGSISILLDGTRVTVNYG